MSGLEILVCSVVGSAVVRQQSGRRLELEVELAAKVLSRFGEIRRVAGIDQGHELRFAVLS